MRAASVAAVFGGLFGLLVFGGPPPTVEPAIQPQVEWPQVDRGNPESVDAWIRAQGLHARQAGAVAFSGPHLDVLSAEPETYLGWLPNGCAFECAPPEGVAYSWEGASVDTMLTIGSDRWLDKRTYKLQPAPKMPDDKGWRWCYDLTRGHTVRLPSSTLVKPYARFKFVAERGK
jgi:hypothetical protein